MLEIYFKNIKKQSNGSFLINFQIETDKFDKATMLSIFVERELKHIIENQKKLKEFLAVPAEVQ